MTTDEMRRLHAASTPGEWAFTPNDWNCDEDRSDLSGGSIKGGDGWYIAELNGQPCEDADSAFIVSAHNSMPELLDRLDAAERDVVQLRAALFDIRQHAAPSGYDRGDAAIDAIAVKALEVSDGK